MTSWRPAAGVQAARDRAAMMRRIRDYFDVEDVLEVDTPSLSNSAVSDTQIESFEIPTSLVSQRPMYLHTSPEFCMKRLLCAGFPDIFSICRVFRDGESGRRHQPEFTMIEWYRLGLGLDSIIDDTLRMIRAALTTAVLRDEAIQFEYRDCFVSNANVDPLTATIEELADAAGADGQLRQSIGAERDDWLDLILTTRVAPGFEPHRLTVLRHYPASQAALARLCPNDSRVADRFEVFFGAVELANGYVELVDAEDQAVSTGHRAHTMAHSDAAPSPLAGHGACRIREHDRIAEPEPHGDAPRLHARPLLHEQELAARVRLGRHQPDGHLQRKRHLTVSILMQPVVVVGPIAQQQRGRTRLPGVATSRDEAGQRRRRGRRAESFRPRARHRDDAPVELRAQALHQWRQGPTKVAVRPAPVSVSTEIDGAPETGIVVPQVRQLATRPRGQQ